MISIFDRSHSLLICFVGCAFKRLFEGGHSGQSQHYAGSAFDTGHCWMNRMYI